MVPEKAYHLDISMDFNKVYLVDYCIPILTVTILRYPKLCKRHDACLFYPQVLIQNGADVNTPFAALNTTALMTSSYHGHVDVVRLLLENGADVQMVDLQQSTALGYSFGGEHLRYLLLFQQMVCRSYSSLYRSVNSGMLSSSLLTVLMPCCYIKSISCLFVEKV